MRRILFILLIVSIITNLVFLVVRSGRKHRMEKKASLFVYKKTPYDEGYKYLQMKAEKQHPKLNLKNKNSIICFWDSLSFESIGYETMEDLDSLSNVFGKYSFNYIFTTEIKEKLAKEYLQRAGMNYGNLEIMGDMDKFMSAVYTTCPSKFKMIFMGDTVKAKRLFSHHKAKPFYLVMDTLGKIIYYTNSYFLPSKDTAFMRIAKSSILTKPLEKL